MSGEFDSFLKWYTRTIDAKSAEYLERKKYWTEALAVGSQSWIQKMKGRIGSNRLRALDVEEKITKASSAAYREAGKRTKQLVRETPAPYALY